MAQKTITEFQQVPGSLENSDELLVYDDSVGITRKADLSQVLEQPAAHAADNTNPHSVTKTQVGLENVTDDAQLKMASNLSDIPDPATARTNLGVAAAGDISAHLADNANPHSVSKAQVGLASVLNEQQLTPLNNLSDVGDAATARTNIEAASDNDLTTHTGDFGNPHSVTPAQAGVKHTKEWYLSGALSIAVEQGGVWIVPRALVIEKVYIYCKTTGSVSSTIVDINKNGTTIFTTQANRPDLAFDDGDKKAESGAPDVTALVEGDIVSIDVDQIATGAADLSAIIICK
jgi:hypothetical protein